MLSSKKSLNLRLDEQPSLSMYDLEKGRKPQLYFSGSFHKIEKNNLEFQLMECVFGHLCLSDNWILSTLSPPRSLHCLTLLLWDICILREGVFSVIGVVKS